VNYFTCFNCWLLPSDAKGVGPSAQPTLIYKKEKFWAFSQPNPIGLGLNLMLNQPSLGLSIFGSVRFWTKINNKTDYFF
jgi:hypothetical protein